MAAGEPPASVHATYYVSSNGSTGGSGTETEPFMKIAEATAKAVAGDTIYLEPGIYFERVIVSRSGSEGAPITLSGVPDGEAIIDASADDRGIVVRGSHIIVKNLTVQNSRWWGISVEGAYDVLDNLTVRDSQGAAVYFHATGDGAVHDNALLNSKIYNNVISNISHNFNGNAWDSAVGTWGDRARYLINNIIFEGNLIYNNQGEGIDCYIIDGCTVRYNKLHDNFSVNLYADDATNSTFLCNFVYSENNTAFFRKGRPASGIQLADEVPDHPSKNIIFRDNLVVGTPEPFRYGNYGAPVGMHGIQITDNTLVAWAGWPAISIDRARHDGSVIVANFLVGPIAGADNGIVIAMNQSASTLPLDRPPPCMAGHFHL